MRSTCRCDKLNGRESGERDGSDGDKEAYIFFGRVQGVGFRYHCYYKARQLGLTGWVKNRYDGSVEMEMQGREEEMDELLLYLERQRFIRIDAMEVKTIPTIEEYDFYRR